MANAASTNPDALLSYSWTGPGITAGANTASPTVDMAGTYILTVTDGDNGCIGTCSVEVGEDITPPSCAPFAVRPETGPMIRNGSFSFILAGGTAPYSFTVVRQSDMTVIDMGSGLTEGTQIDVTSLEVGDYVITSTGANSCTSQCFATIFQGNITIVKTIVMAPEPTGMPNEFSLMYEIVVANIGDVPGSYDLFDTLSYGDGVTVISAEPEYVMGGDGLGSSILPLSYTENEQIVMDEPIAPSGIDKYKVTVTILVDPNVVTEMSSDCSMDEDETGTGLLNTATVAFMTSQFEGSVAARAAMDDVLIFSDTACAKIPMPSVDIVKFVSAEPEPIMGSPGMFAMQYSIDVIGTGDAVAFYDLVDTFKFGGGISPTNVIVTYDPSNTDGLQGTFYGFDGESKHVIIDDEEIQPGATERWLIDLEFLLVPSEIVQSEIDCVLDPGEDGTGLFNCANVEDGVPYEADSACTNIPCFFEVTCPPSDLGTITCKDPPPAYAETAEDFIALGGSFGDLNCGEIVILGKDEPWGPLCAKQTIERTYIIFDDLNTNGTLDDGEASDTCYQQYMISASTWRILGLPADVTVACGEDVPPWADVTATDECGAEITISRQAVPGFASCGGEFIERRWTASDACGNFRTVVQTIRFTDDEAPVLTVPDDLKLACGDTIPEPTHEVSDNCSRVGVTLEVERVTFNQCEYDIIRTWTAVDGCGNRTSGTQTISVADIEVPVISLVPEMAAMVNEDGDMVIFGCDFPEMPQTGALVTDDCCVDPAALVTFDRLVSQNVCGVFGFHTRYRCGYMYTDAAGHEAILAFDVYQYDTTAPVIHNLPPDLALSCNSLIAPVDTNAVFAGDDCGRTLDGSFAQKTIVNPANTDQFMIQRTWSFADDCGNSSSSTQNISLCDFEPNSDSFSIVGNTVWIDSDENGIQDIDEQGLNDVNVYLYLMPEGHTELLLIDSTRTATHENISGQYQFDRLLPGEYAMRFVEPDGYSFTIADAQENDMDVQDSDADETNGMVSNILLEARSELQDLDVGLVQDSTTLDLEGEGPDLSNEEGGIGTHQNPDLEDEPTLFSPNPTDGRVGVTMRASSVGEVSIAIHDQYGKHMRTVLLEHTRGLNRFDLDLGAYPAGMYTVQLLREGRLETKRVIKN